MAELEVILIELEEDTPLFGVCGESCNRRRSSDISKLTGEYCHIIGKPSDEIVPFFVMSKNYERKTGRFSLFVGGLFNHDELSSAIVPKGLYGRVTVRPKFGFIWGFAIGEAKRFFYRKWLPGSGYRTRNLEYEYHDERSRGKGAEIYVFFAIE